MFSPESTAGPTWAIHIVRIVTISGRALTTTKETRA